MKNDPVNKNASMEARNLLNFIYEINVKNILTGHHDKIHEMSKFNEDIY